MEKKQELIQMHHLLKNVADEFEVETPSYEQISIAPMSLHKSRDDHTEAIQRLADDITENIDEIEA